MLFINDEATLKDDVTGKIVPQVAKQNPDGILLIATKVGSASRPQEPAILPEGHFE
jgi:hypothetical protein